MAIKETLKSKLDFCDETTGKIHISALKNPDASRKWTCYVQSWSRRSIDDSTSPRTPL